MLANEKVLDRIEQSFEIFRKAFIYIVLPFFVYNIISFIFFLLVISYFIFSWILSSLVDLLSYNNFFLFLSNPKFIILATLSLFFLLVYLLLFIPFLIYTIKTIWDFYNWAIKIDFKSNFLYATNRFLNIMQTYWYMFAYLALIPSLIFIFWGLIFNIWYFYDLPFDYKMVGWAFMLVWFLFFIVNMIYRWIKSTFALYSAIDCDDYSKENFVQSVTITNKKWWRILWNLILIWAIVWLLSWIASNIFSIFFGKIWDFSSLDFENITPSTLQSFIDAFSFFNYFVSWFFDSLIKTIGTVFIYVFIYVFYKRLYFESNNLEQEKIEKNIKTEEVSVEL